MVCRVFRSYAGLVCVFQWQSHPGRSCFWHFLWDDLLSNAHTMGCYHAPPQKPENFVLFELQSCNLVNTFRCKLWLSSRWVKHFEFPHFQRKIVFPVFEKTILDSLLFHKIKFQTRHGNLNAASAYVSTTWHKHKTSESHASMIQSCLSLPSKPTARTLGKRDVFA